MHREISLSPVRMAQNLMAATLPYFYKSGAQELGENFTGGIRHQESQPERLPTWLRREPSRHEIASPPPTPGSIPGRQQWLLRCRGRGWSDRELEHARNSNPQIRVRLLAR